MLGSSAIASNRAPQREKSSSPAFRWLTVLAPGVIVLAAVAAYHNGFAGQFIFDDSVSITENPTIRHLWPIWNVLSPPATAGVGGRPVVNLSLAVNYALGGRTVQGYHALNLAIHILAGLTLFGVARRTLLRQVLRGRFDTSAPRLALAAAVLWAVHPLQTEAVTYVSQRAESLMGLFYLLTVYCFIRGTESVRSGLWFTLSLVACLLGMASKEVMVSAPLLVLLYDRTFVAGSFREAWTRRWRLYLALAGTWLLLGHLMTDLPHRGVGYGLGVTWWAYALTECQVIMRYLRLAVWPYPLVFDYGTDIMIRHAVEAAPYALILLLLVAGVVVALKRWPTIGFVGAWFFAILAPTSSVVPVANQPMAESRMYLPLATVIVLVVLGIHALVARRSMVVFSAVALGLGFLTARRNEDYRSGLSIWSDTVAKRPNNVRALNNLGFVLADAGRAREAIARYEQALRLKPDFAPAHLNLGNALSRMGRLPEAVQHYEEALRLKPDYAEAHYGLGNALTRAGRAREAVAHYEEALRLRPDYPEAHNNLGLLLAQAGRMTAAIAHYEQAFQLDPDYAEAHYNLGTVLLQVGRVSDAMVQFEQTLQLKPDYVAARCNFGSALFQLGRVQEAIEQFKEAVRLQPDYADAHYDLGNAFAEAGKLTEAKEQYEQALRLRPDDAEAHNNLGLVLFQLGKAAEAKKQYEEALRLKPDHAEAHNDLGIVLFQLGKAAEAKKQYEEALRLKPDYAEARDNLTKPQAIQQPDAPKN
jgi:protein O-mannosyl-transferase